MTLFKRILVPLDGSERAEAALACVRWLTKPSEESDLVLFQSVRPSTATLVRTFSLWLGTGGTDSRAYLRRKERELSEEGRRARSRQARGDAAEEILKAAREEEASLIAMSTHGRTGLARWALGSVAEQVLRRADRPVLLARGFDEQAHPKSAGPLRILAPTDGSPASTASLPLVEDVARRFNAEILVVYAEPVIPAGTGGSTLAGPWVVPSSIVRPTETATVPVAEQVAAGLRQAGLSARGQSTPGDPADVILELARGMPGGLVVMATHGRSGAGRWFLGSVTEQVLRRCERPLLLARSGSTG